MFCNYEEGPRYEGLSFIGAPAALLGTVCYKLPLFLSLVFQYFICSQWDHLFPVIANEWIGTLSTQPAGEMRQWERPHPASRLGFWGVGPEGGKDLGHAGQWYWEAGRELPLYGRKSPGPLWTLISKYKMRALECVTLLKGARFDLSKGLGARPSFIIYLVHN